MTDLLKIQLSCHCLVQILAGVSTGTLESGL